jgi:hypothetical protein
MLDLDIHAVLLDGGEGGIRTLGEDFVPSTA